MATVSTKEGLEILEKSDLDSLQLIDHATAILSIDLAATTSTNYKDTEETTSSPEHTFREQWVLRWLLKRFISEHGQLGKTEADDPSTRYL